MAKLALVAAATVVLITPNCLGKQDLPELICPVYQTVQDARQDCADSDGSFLTWGQFLNGTEIGNAFGNRTTSADSVGPYWCSTCDGGSDGFGYVGVLGETIPLKVSTYSSVVEGEDGWLSDDYVVGTCPELNGTKEDISCAALQKVCETSGNGWLIFARTFETEEGIYMCSGCDQDGSVIGTGEEEASTLSSWPLLFMYSVIAVVLAVAVYIDIRVFVRGKGSSKMQNDCNIGTTSMHERRSWYVLHVLGYIDEDGKKIIWHKAICTNRWIDLCCCRSKTEFANFLSILLVTLGVSALFGDGHLSEYNCYFDATHTLEYDEGTEERHYEGVFFKDFYGLADQPDKGIPTVIEINPFQAEFVIGEVLAAAYQLSVSLLTRALSEAGYMKEWHSLVLMNFLSAAFCACAFAYDWEYLSMEMLFLGWMAGLILVLLLGPVASAISYLLCKGLVAMNCLSLPDQSEENAPPGQSGATGLEEYPPNAPESTFASDEVIITKMTRTISKNGTITTTTTKQIKKLPTSEHMTPTGFVEDPRSFQGHGAAISTQTAQQQQPIAPHGHMATSGTPAAFASSEAVPIVLGVPVYPKA